MDQEKYSSVLDIADTKSGAEGQRSAEYLRNQLGKNKEGRATKKRAIGTPQPC
jgi:hypothetical protein